MIKKKRNRKKSLHKDPAKEREIKDLIVQVETLGFQVRREELKRGLGWRAQSGACRIEKTQYIFVDRRMSQDDQIDFLKGQLLVMSPPPVVENE